MIPFCTKYAFTGSFLLNTPNSVVRSNPGGRLVVGQVMSQQVRDSYRFPAASRMSRYDNQWPRYCRLVADSSLVWLFLSAFRLGPPLCVADRRLLSSLHKFKHVNYVTKLCTVSPYPGVSRNPISSSWCSIRVNLYTYNGNLPCA